MGPSISKPDEKSSKNVLYDNAFSSCTHPDILAFATNGYNVTEDMAGDPKSPLQICQRLKSSGWKIDEDNFDGCKGACAFWSVDYVQNKDGTIQINATGKFAKEVMDLNKKKIDMVNACAGATGSSEFDGEWTLEHCHFNPKEECNIVCNEGFSKAEPSFNDQLKACKKATGSLPESTEGLADWKSEFCTGTDEESEYVLDYPACNILC